MEIRISNISKSERDNFLHQSNQILANTEGPLRLRGVVNKKTHQQVLFLRERTWGEFFLEKLIRTPQEIEDVENEALAALELTFLLLIDDAECGNGRGEGKGGRENLVYLEEAQERRRSSGYAYIDNDDVKYQKMSWNGKANICKRFLRSRIIKESGSKCGKDEKDPDVSSCKKLKTSNGLITMPSGISVSTCPALQVIAHNTVVSNLKIGAMCEVEPFSPMERALDAFRDGWKEVSRRLSIMPTSIYRVPLMSGLRHIENLLCFADTSKRTESDALANNDSEFWKNFYLNPCRKLKGSIVLGLYPDFYSKDKSSGAVLPFYSRNNIKGAVDAAIELSSSKRSDGYEPVSFMFAEKDIELANLIAEEIENRKIESTSSMEIEGQRRMCSQGQETEIFTSRGAAELSAFNGEVEEKKNCDNFSPERKFVLGQLYVARDNLKKASVQKKLQKISANLSNLPKEDLAAVLGNLEQGILNESFTLVSLTASDKTTLSKPLRPIFPGNLPTPKTKTLKLGVRQAIVRREKKFKTGSAFLFQKDTATDE